MGTDSSADIQIINMLFVCGVSFLDTNGRPREFTHTHSLSHAKTNGQEDAPFYFMIDIKCILTHTHRVRKKER